MKIVQNMKLGIMKKMDLSFIVNMFAEIADFFINFWVDNVIVKFAKGNK